MKSAKLFPFFLFWALSTAFAQQTIITGKVIESETGSPIPFANVIFTGTMVGAITDFDGNYIAKTNAKVDSIEVHYIGFIKRVKVLEPGKTQVINFQLDEDVQTLGEVVVLSGENPAWPVMRKLVANKKSNDLRNLEAYEYESYTKIEFDVNNLTESFKSRKVIQKISSVMDSIQQLAGEDGTPIMPVFMSEAMSRYYYRSNPTFKHENIIKTKVSGVGITDGTLSSQIIGSTFQQYNFYQNWLSILNKEFVSPIADGWKIYYEVYLEDSVMIDDQFCYRLDFFPKREQDLAFVGTMWVAKEDYGLKRIDASIPREANLNFIDRLKIQQDMIKVADGAWLPLKTRVVIDGIELLKNSPSVLAKFYISTDDHVINKPLENKAYLNPVAMEDGVRDADEEYWATHRHDSLTETELNVFEMIDTLKKLPFVKTSMEAAKFAFTGYLKSNKVDIGPYTTFAGNNNIEGWRAGFGLRTNYSFSDKWTLGGHFGYGFGDEEWKYRVYVDRIIKRHPWTSVRLECQKEVDQVWSMNEQYEPTSLFYTYSRFGTLVQPFAVNKYRFSLFRQIATGLNADFSLKHMSFDPLFDFQYYDTPEDPVTSSSYNVSEARLKLRFAKDELFVINDNERVSLGALRWPTFDVDYTYGFKGLFGSAFEYHKFKLSIQKRQKMGLFGIGKFKLIGGYIVGDLPYTMLYNTIGNETPVYVNFAFNLMDYFEFSNDKYVELRYRHSFEGFILNSIPLLKKLKWRLIGSANILAGSMNDENYNMVQYESDVNGDQFVPFYRMDQRPYVELGYGIENIFRFFSVEAFHRVTYLDRSDVSRFALKFNAQFIL